MALVALAGAGGPAGAAAARKCGRFGLPPRKATLHQLRTSTLCLVNEARKRHGLRPLRFSAALRRAADRHSKDMVRSGRFSHVGSRGSTLTRRITRAGYLARAGAYALAENIGGGPGRRFGSPRAVVRRWLRSPHHRANILRPAYRDFGVGVARGWPYGGGRRAATYTLNLGVRR